MGGRDQSNRLLIVSHMGFTPRMSNEALSPPQSPWEVIYPRWPPRLFTAYEMNIMEMKENGRHGGGETGDLGR